MGILSDRKSKKIININDYTKKEVTEYSNRCEIKPLVSVIVLTYNHVNYIRDCIEGILIQNVDFPIEIIIGEDESSDGTRKICIDYAKRYPDKIRLFLHNRENVIRINGKPTGRFNFLYSLSKARGKYIAYCEGDDYWTHPLKLQSQVNFLQNNPDFVMCSHEVEIIYEDVKEKKLFGEPVEVSCFEDILKNDLFINLNTIVFKASAVSEIPKWFLRLWATHESLILLIMLKGLNYHIKDIMGVKRKNPGGVTVNPVYKKSKLFIKKNKIYFYKKLNHHTGKRYSNSINEIISRKRFQLMHFCISKKMGKITNRNIVKKAYNLLKPRLKPILYQKR